MIGSLFAKEEQYAELTAFNIDMEPYKISLKIVIENNIATDRVAIYFTHSLYNYAIYLEKEQRKQLVEFYEKYEKWKNVAYKNQVSHMKEIGRINKIKNYFSYGGGDWNSGIKTYLSVTADVGERNGMAFILPKLISANNEYIDADKPFILFMEPSKMDTSDIMTNLLEQYGISTPKEFIIDNLADTNLVVIRRKLVEDAKKEKNIDSLFD